MNKIEPILPPLLTSRVAAGFPSPAEDYAESALDLNTLCISNPYATFFVRASGDSMIDAGIFAGDILIVDKSVEAQPGNIVIAIIDGDFTVKRLKRHNQTLFLVPENKLYAPIELTGEMEVSLWGVVTFVIHQV